MNGKILVTSFSASGVTAGVARELAQAIGADLCEIAPVQPYSSADLDEQEKPQHAGNAGPRQPPGHEAADRGPRAV